MDRMAWSLVISCVESVVEVRLWDLAAGKCSVTLTNHKKSVRALGIHPLEYTFISCSSDNNKVWKCPKGAFERNIQGHNAIVNCRPGCLEALYLSVILMTFILFYVNANMLSKMADMMYV